MYINLEYMESRGYVPLTIRYVGKRVANQGDILWAFLKTVELVEDKSHSFATLLPKTVDFADFRSLFIKVHSFGHSVLGRLPRDF